MQGNEAAQTPWPADCSQTLAPMKNCPRCSFTNEERFPTCVWCNAPIVDVRSIPSNDPNSPEHAWRATNERRRSLCTKQIRFAQTLYALAIVVSAFGIGFVTNPLTLGLYFLGSLIVITFIELDLAGRFTASFLQAGISVALLAYFGPAQVLMFYLLALHILLPMLLWHWIDMIYGATR